MSSSSPPGVAFTDTGKPVTDSLDNCLPTNISTVVLTHISMYSGSVHGYMC